MVRTEIEYLGDLQCKAVHGPSGAELITDAPVDNQGKGQNFSPTDLAGVALGTCVATIMGIMAKRHEIDIKGLKISVDKEMINEPVRRIKKLTLAIVFPRELPEREFKILSAAVEGCPISKSLHPEVEVEKSFSFGQ